MKATDIIADHMRDWTTVDAPEQARHTFAALDDDERNRLALRAFTDEWRAALRVKDEGVPRFTSVTRRGDDGAPVRVYKQTSLFSKDDYMVAVTHYVQQGHACLRVAAALAADCHSRLGVQITIPGMSA